MGYADEMGQYLGDFLPCTHDGHPSRLPDMCDLSQLWARLFANVTVEEDQNLQHDRGRGDHLLSCHRQMAQKGTDV
jgi:hypothetical protein